MCKIVLRYALHHRVASLPPALFLSLAFFRFPFISALPSFALSLLSVLLLTIVNTCRIFLSPLICLVSFFLITCTFFLGFFSVYHFCSFFLHFLYFSIFVLSACSYFSLISFLLRIFLSLACLLLLPLLILFMSFLFFFGFFFLSFHRRFLFEESLFTHRFSGANNVMH